MSFKASNLVYAREQPRFLKSLQTEFDSKDPARQSHPIPRSRRQQVPEEDDGPTYVLEKSDNSISHAEYEALLLEGRMSTDKNIPSRSHDHPTIPESSLLEAETLDKERAIGVGTKVGFGNASKRKLGRALGAACEIESTEIDQKPLEPHRKRTIKGVAKRIKLSFNDEEP